MAELINSYWELVEPVFSKINIYDGPEKFTDSIADLWQPAVYLYAAHMCLSEVHNGGLLQLFWNNTGVLVPEAIDAFKIIGMPMTASLVTGAAAPLGARYPRDRENRWDALLAAAHVDEDELTRIFEKIGGSNPSNFYLAFQEATRTLPFESLNKQLWDAADTENGGFQNAATRYAQSVNRVQ